MSTTEKKPGKPPRVLACIRCQQRKVRCDRNIPCSNCIRVGVQDQCAPATLAPRQRRRRFPERDLLDRLRHYEDLLRQHNIPFQPLHPSAGDISTTNEDDQLSVTSEQQHAYPTPLADVPKAEDSTGKTGAVDIWQAMNQTSSDAEDDESDDMRFAERIGHTAIRPSAVKKALGRLFQNRDHLIFGPQLTNMPLSAFHPEQTIIFRLWQIYLDNFSPLLKVTHTPTLQARFLEAASNVTTISPVLQALMFSIYCVAVVSLPEEDCVSSLGSAKSQLLSNYQLACQHALQECGVLRTSDRECLTALYLYLISLRSDTDPQTLASLTAIAIRIAKRMGMHNESANAKCSAFEAEMRRRLWWSLVSFDNRTCEMSDLKASTLDPSWDCRVPLNINDFDMRPEMTNLPASHRIPTEALYTVVCSEVGNFVRHSSFHLDFKDPSAKKASRPFSAEKASLDDIKHTLETKYFAFCNLENPLHYVTIWTARTWLAKCRLLEHYSQVSGLTAQLTDGERDAATTFAHQVLECDTKLSASPLTKGFFWQLHFQFPFPSYIHIISDLRKRPLAEPAEKAWKAMSDNFQARFTSERDISMAFRLFARAVLAAWDVREGALAAAGRPIDVPAMVADIRRRKGQQDSETVQDANAHQPSDIAAMSLDDFSAPMPIDFGLGWGGQVFPGIFEQAPMDIDINQLFDWTADLNPMNG